MINGYDTMVIIHVYKCIYIYMCVMDSYRYIIFLDIQYGFIIYIYTYVYAHIFIYVYIYIYFRILSIDNRGYILLFYG